MKIKFSATSICSTICRDGKTISMTEQLLEKYPCLSKYGPVEDDLHGIIYITISGREVILDIIQEIGDSCVIYFTPEKTWDIEIYDEYREL